MILLILATILTVFYIFKRLTRGLCESSVCLVGKTALVTGANSGLGYETVLNLASRGCRVIMADVEDMEQSKNNVIRLTNNNNIETKKLDLSCFQSVRDFAGEIMKNESRLDILINNAGIAASKHKRTKDGLHPVMQVNYFSHFLLTHLLIDLLKKSAPSRIVFNTSSGSFFSNLSIKNLNYDVEFESLFSKTMVYCNSKCAALIASDIFAEKLKGTGVISNSVHPGNVQTGLYQKFATSFALLKPVVLFIVFFPHVFGKTPWEGAQVLVYAAVSEKIEGMTGKFFWDCKSLFKPVVAYDREFCQKIWEQSEKFVRLEEHERL